MAPSARVPVRGIMKTLTIVGALLACASLVAGSADAQQKASADIKDATGKKVGEAILEQRDGAVQITATFTGLPPGEHAFHIHEVGKCDPPFESAGGHFKVKDLSLDGARGGLLDRDGAALVVHEGADDYKSDPAGNAGKRLACGVIRR